MVVGKGGGGVREDVILDAVVSYVFSHWCCTCFVWAIFTCHCPVSFLAIFRPPHPTPQSPDPTPPPPPVSLFVSRTPWILCYRVAPVYDSRYSTSVLRECSCTISVPRCTPTRPDDYELWRVHRCYPWGAKALSADIPHCSHIRAAAVTALSDNRPQIALDVPSALKARVCGSFPPVEATGGHSSELESACVTNSEASRQNIFFFFFFLSWTLVHSIQNTEILLSVNNINLHSFPGRSYTQEMRREWIVLQVTFLEVFFFFFFDQLLLACNRAWHVTLNHDVVRVWPSFEKKVPDAALSGAIHETSKPVLFSFFAGALRRRTGSLRVSGLLSVRGWSVHFQ